VRGTLGRGALNVLSLVYFDVGTWDLRSVPSIDEVHTGNFGKTEVYRDSFAEAKVMKAWFRSFSN